MGFFEFPERTAVDANEQKHPTPQAFRVSDQSVWAHGALKVRMRRICHIQSNSSTVRQVKSMGWDDPRKRERPSVSVRSGGLSAVQCLLDPLGRFLDCCALMLGLTFCHVIFTVEKAALGQSGLLAFTVLP